MSFSFTAEPCQPGTFSDDGLVPCRACPIGSYQNNREGKTCQQCPGGTITADIGASVLAECRSKLFSPYIHYYSDYLVLYSPYIYTDFFTICNNNYKSDKSDHPFSLVACPTGMYSKSGLEPCTFCSVGFYQPDKGQKDCVKCSGKDSTHGVGSQQKSQCSCKPNTLLSHASFLTSSLSFCYLIFLFNKKKQLPSGQNRRKSSL